VRPGQRCPPLAHELAVTRFHARPASQLDSEAVTPTAWSDAGLAASLPHLVGSLPDFEQMVTKVIDTVINLFGAEKAGVMLYDPGSQQLVLQTPAFGLANPDIIDRYRVSIADGGNAIGVFTSGRSYLSNDCPNDPHILQEYVALFGSRKVMTVPLRVGGRIIGVLHVTNKREGDFSGQELLLLEGVADQLATLIDNARLFQVSRRSEHEADTLYQLALHLSELLDVEEICSHGLRTSTELLHAETAGVQLNSGWYHAHDGRSPPHIVQGRGPSSILPRPPATDGPVHVAFDNDVSQHPISSWQRALASRGLSEALVMPLIMAREVKGSLFVARGHSPGFTGSDERLLARLGLLLGSAVRNADLHRETEHAVQELRHSNDKRARVWANHERLTEMVLRGEGLPALTSAISAMVDNPVLLEDRGGQLLGWSAPPGWGGPRPASLAQVSRRSSEAARLVKRLAVEGRAARLPAVADEVSPRYVAPVAVAADTLAMLSVPEVASRLDAFDLLAVQEAATVVALVLMRERIALETERRLRGDLLTEIVTGVVDDEENLLRRATLLGHDLRAPHALVLVDVQPSVPRSGSREASGPGQSVTHDLYELVRELLWRDTPQWLIASRGSQALALLPVLSEGLDQKALATARRLHAAAAQRWPTARASVVLSRVCHGVQEIASCCSEAQRFLELHRALGRRSGLILVERLGLYSILLQQRELGQELVVFATDRLGPLREHDVQHGGNLVGCLRAYLAAGGELKATARELYLHRNSVRYKLRRIAEITGLDLHDPEVRFQLQLALRILDVRSALS
jgi:sugar diacid utilization regulator/GAF domain-containing protein